MNMCSVAKYPRPHFGWQSKFWLVHYFPVTVIIPQWGITPCTYVCGGVLVKLCGLHCGKAYWAVEWCSGILILISTLLPPHLGCSACQTHNWSTRNLCRLSASISIDSKLVGQLLIQGGLFNCSHPKISKCQPVSKLRPILRTVPTLKKQRKKKVKVSELFPL